MGSRLVRITKSSQIRQLTISITLGDIQTFTGLNAKDSEKMMEVLSLAKRSIFL
jgi:hypothetical protein